MEKRMFDYYATIICSDVDERWAKWVQRKLEKYRFPISLRKEYTELPARISPVFRDKSQALGDSFQAELEERLEQSEYLIVICSPDSARVDWLDRQISYFQKLGRNRNIIPLIVDGEPHSKNPARECYSPALLNKEDEELLGVSVRELGPRQAVLRIIASLMQLRFDQLVMRDKRRVRRRRMTAAGFLATLFIILAGVVWYETPHSSCYWSYVYRNEIPVGLVKISQEDQKTAHDYYRIVTCKNKVVRLERRNFLGEITDSLSAIETDDFPVTEFTYDEKGRLKSATKQDSFGNVRMVRDYSQDLGTVDLRCFDDGSEFLNYAYSDQGEPSCFEITSAEEEITRHWLEYDETGYLIRETYLRDRNNTSACDRNGVYGKVYLRDEEDGKILRVTNLGEDGEPIRPQYDTGVTYTDYEYDTQGRVIKSFVYDVNGEPASDEDGVFGREYGYSASGSLSQMLCRDAEGELCADKNGVAQYRFVCDDNGRLAERYGEDESGGAVYAKDTGVYRTVYETDESEGGIVSEAYYGADGNLMINNNGYARQTLRRDTRGRIVERWVYGLDQKPVYDTAGENCAGYTVEYPDENTIRYSCYNAEGEAALCREGYAGCTIRVRESDGWESVVEKSYYDVAGNPVRARDNAASIVYQFDAEGLLASEAYFDETGVPCSNRLGVSVVEYGYRGGNLISREYYNLEGEPCCVEYAGGYYSKVEMEYDLYGRVTRICCYDGDGNQVNVDGVREKQLEYDENENCVRYKYCDYEGRLTDNAEGYAVREVVRDERGAVISECCRNHEDILLKEQKFGYDGKGNLIFSEVHTFDENGAQADLTAEYEYDEHNRVSLVRETANGGAGHVVKENRYDEYNRLVEVSQYEAAVTSGEQRGTLMEKAVYAYDVYGNQTQVRRYDRGGKLICGSDGVAYMETVYNVMGDIIRETNYDVGGEIIEGEDGVAIREAVYDAAGRPVLYRLFDSQGVLLSQKAGGYPAYISIRWNEEGRREEEILLNESGEYLNSEKYVNPRTVYSYNQHGIRTLIRHYDCQNQLTDTQVYVPCVTYVEPDSAADTAGIDIFSILVKYGDWSLFGYEDYADINFIELENAMIAGSREEKWIQTGVVTEKDDSSRKIRFTDHKFEAGGTGMRFTILWVDLEVVEQMQERYKETEDIRRRRRVVQKLIEAQNKKANSEE